MEKKKGNLIPHKNGHSCPDYAVEVQHNDYECSRCGKKLSVSVGRQVRQ